MELLALISQAIIDAIMDGYMAHYANSVVSLFAFKCQLVIARDCLGDLPLISLMQGQFPGLEAMGACCSLIVGRAWEKTDKQ